MTADVGDGTTPAARSPGSGIRPQTPTLNQLAGPPAKINGKTHGQADSAGRQELQVVIHGFGHLGNHGSAAPALVYGGRHYGVAHHHIL